MRERCMKNWEPTAQKRYGKFVAVSVSPTGHTQRLGCSMSVTVDGSDIRHKRSGQRRFDTRDEAVAFAKTYTDIWNVSLVQRRAA